MSGERPVPVEGRIIYDFDPPVKPAGKEIGANIVGSGAPFVTGDKLSVSKTPKTLSGGVLNGKALSLPKPTYHAAARAVGASGPVRIQVLILEDGTVFSAKAVSGHRLLHFYSEIAACGAKFMPTLLERKPVKVAGAITYNYVP